MSKISIERTFQIAVEHHQAGQLSQADALYRQILAREPKHADALHHLGLIAHQGGRNEAVDLIRQAIALRPNFPQAFNNLGNVLREKGKPQEAIVAYRQAIARKSNYAEAYSNLGNALKDTGQVSEAIAAYHRAIALKPNYPGAYSNLGNALRDSGQGDEAIAAFGQAIALKPDYAEAFNNLGNALKDVGQVDEAIAAYRRAIEFRPGYSDAHSNLLHTLHYQPGYDPQSIAREHSCWNRQHAEPLKQFILPHANDPNPDRRLRIGYVSPDLRQHSVAYFLENLLAHHDAESVEVTCYSDVVRPDATTARLKKLSAQWCDIAGLNDAQVEQRVREDGIDILVDLAGHTANNRLLLFARKPAPVQVTYLGYPDSTGLRTMDYRLTDAYADPPGIRVESSTEQLVRLPGTFLCYRPSDVSPQVGPVAALGNGHVTFGSFNALAKVNAPLVAMWSKILDQVPKSRLILKGRGLGSATAQQHILELFVAHDIGPDRVEMVGWIASKAEHLQLYNRIDIALDTFPYHGATTTCEAMWMGVPVITLAGKAHVSRVGVSLLSNVGMPDLIADSQDGYVRVASELAGDVARLGQLRSTLRQQMQQSPLMDAPRFARNVEAAYRQMWQTWCANSKQNPVRIPEANTALSESENEKTFQSAVRAHQAGQLPQAQALYRKILAQQPKHAGALHHLGMIAHQAGRIDIAVDLIRQAIAIKPDYAEAYSNLASALGHAGRLEEAIAACRQAIALRPDLAEAYSNLGNALRATGQVDEAIAAFRRAVALRPHYAEVFSNLGNALKDMGQLDDAIAAYRRAVELKPNLAAVHSNLVYTIHFHPGYDAKAIAQELSSWNRQHAEPLRKFIRMHANDRNPDRRLRIGYVSPYFCDHVVGQNMLPLFAAHDHGRFEIVCYALRRHHDASAARFGALADIWRDVAANNDDEIAQMIRRDEIDILVDLSLHMDGNRLLVFARKPAPVQATFAGYPGSTGLSAIDYRLTDPFLDPPGTDADYGEQSIRLPDSFWCYDPLTAQPQVNQLPAASADHIVFGCLNNLCKVTDYTLDLWTQVLERVSASRLILLSPPGEHRRGLLAKFSARKIDPGRIEFVPFQPRQDYLREYHRIDLGLDTLPYNGHTTSLDSFWMGVPVVTRVGKTVVGRAGWSQLSNLNLTELAGQTDDQFVSIAAQLAGDRPRLSALRSSLRATMQSSALMDAPKFARHIESAYRRMWRTWCGTPAVHS